MSPPLKAAEIPSGLRVPRASQYSGWLCNSLSVLGLYKVKEGSFPRHTSVGGRNVLLSTWAVLL